MVGASAKVYGKFNLGIVEPDQLQQQQQSINQSYHKQQLREVDIIKFPSQDGLTKKYSNDIIIFYDYFMPGKG